MLGGTIMIGSAHKAHIGTNYTIPTPKESEWARVGCSKEINCQVLMLMGVYSLI